MPLVRIRHTQPNGRARWLESVVHADDADALVWMRVPTKPAGDSNLKPATHSNTKPAGVPI